MIVIFPGANIVLKSIEFALGTSKIHKEIEVIALLIASLIE